MSNLEILSPVGSSQALKAAVLSGADAVYLGGDRFSARAYANNFGGQALVEAVFYAHSHDVKVYYALNTLIKETEIKDALIDAQAAYEAGVDAIILQDMGLITLIRQTFPDFEIHGSTQMTVHNSYGIDVLKAFNIKRVVLSRELALEEIKHIKDQTDMALEIFVHGALCYAYSGQCLMSSLIGGRSGNRGRCAQTCRLAYQVKTDDGISENAFFLSPKDINSLELLDALKTIGVDSLKIEGRMKGEAYVAKVTKLYKDRLNGGRTSEKDLTDLSQLFNRGGFTDGYLKADDNKEMITLDRPNHQGVLVGEVIRYAKKKGIYQVKWYQAIHKGDTLRIDDANNKNFIINTSYDKGTSEVYIKGKPIKGKTKIYRVVDKALSESIMDKLIDEKPVAKGQLKCKFNQPLQLKLTYKDYHATISGDMVESAVKQPVTEDWLIEQVQKTGNELMDIRPVKVDMDEDIFVSTKAIKSIRRQAIKSLVKSIADPYNRQVPDLLMSENASKEAIKQEKQSLTVLLRNRQQFETIIGYNVDNIYIDILYVSPKECQLMMKHKPEDSKIYLRLPTIIRQKDEAYVRAYLEMNMTCDGYVVGSLDSYGFVKGMDKKIIADQGLWALNNQSIDALMQLGIEAYTISPELNYGEIAGLNVHKAIINLYGYQGVMYTAQCAFKESKGCNHKPGYYELIDRKGNHLKAFKQCGLCINQIFNAHPLYLLDEIDGLKRLGIHHYRIDLLDEDIKTIERIMEGYHKVKPAKEAGFDVFTKGHFNKGVL